MSVGAATAAAAAAAAASIAAPARGIFFLPPYSRPPWPAHGEPAPNSLTHPHPARPAYTPTRGPRPGPLRRETRAGKAPGVGGPEARGRRRKRPASEAGESWAGTGRLRQLGPQRPRSARPHPRACPPRRRKRRRLGRLRSRSIQTVTAAASPPIPSPRPPRPGPAVSPPRRSPL